MIPLQISPAGWDLSTLELTEQSVLFWRDFHTCLIPGSLSHPLSMSPQPLLLSFQSTFLPMLWVCFCPMTVTSMRPGTLIRLGISSTVHSAGSTVVAPKKKKKCRVNEWMDEWILPSTTPWIFELQNNNGLNSVFNQISLFSSYPSGG